MRAWILAALLAVAAALIVAGVALVSRPAAFIAAGVLLASWSVLILAEARS